MPDPVRAGIGFQRKLLFFADYAKRFTSFGCSRTPVKPICTAICFASARRDKACCAEVRGVVAHVPSGKQTFRVSLEVKCAIFDAFRD